MATACHSGASSNQDYSEKNHTERPASAGGAVPRFSARERLALPCAPAPDPTNNTSSALGNTGPRAGNGDTGVGKSICIYCNKVLLPGPQFMLFHLSVCTALRCPKITLEFQDGDIMDEAYRSPIFVLAQVVDCASMRPFGVSRVIVDKYPFSNPYAARKSVGAFNWACHSNRATPGTIAIYKSSRNQEHPFVVSMFSQFYKGKEVEHNSFRQNLVSQLRRVSRVELEQGLKSDEHFIEGLESDTQENRVLWLQQCLRKLTRFVRRAYVKKVVFPYLIGNDLSLDDWEKHYVPAIKNFFDEVTRFKVNVVVLNVGENAKM